MKNKIHPSPKGFIREAGELLDGSTAKIITPEKWQGMRLSNRMVEVFDTVLRCIIPENIETLKETCSPDHPWAEDHFQERISGEPTNPGFTYLYWPYYRPDEYLSDKGFTHTYQERFWPKQAGSIHTAIECGIEEAKEDTNEGLRFELGDLKDLINHLAENPSSRQAYLPVWFPEDTGVTHKGRVPCTLGYLFSFRDGYLHMTYYIRSCDYIRHFKNDVYMACRLAQHVLLELQKLESPIRWERVRLGRLKMDIESLHMFESDTLELKKRIKFKNK